MNPIITDESAQQFSPSELIMWKNRWYSIGLPGISVVLVFFKEKRQFISTVQQYALSFCILFIFWSLTVTEISSGKVRQCCQQHNKGLHPSTSQKKFRKLFRTVLKFISCCFSSKTTTTKEKTNLYYLQNSKNTKGL